MGLFFVPNVLLTEAPYHLALVALVNAALILASIWNFVKLLAFLVHYIFLFFLVTRLHISNLNASIGAMLFTLRNGQMPTGGFFLLERKLSFFYAEHGRLQRVQQTVNRNIASKLLLGALLCNVLLQIVLVNLLLMENLRLEEKVAIAVMLLIQVSVAFTSCKYLIAWTDCLYSSDRFLFIAQGLLTRRRNALFYPKMLAVKWKLGTVYEQLCTKRELRFTLGPFGEVSKRSFLEVRPKQS